MILHAMFRHRIAYAETLPRMSAIVTELMTSLESEGWATIDGREYYSPGVTVNLGFAERRHDGISSVPDNLLTVAINRSTGFGALYWCVYTNSPRVGGIYERGWVSDNPEPPTFDPRVVGDNDTGQFHDPRNALPLSTMRQVLEEYCRVGTGDRPTAVNWVEGDMCGRRA
jgi:hypothetical protein